MASVIAAHRGYEYQDLLVACRLVDVLLGSVVQVHVDEKLTEDDRFDDLALDVPALALRELAAHAELVSDRGVALVLGRVPGVDGDLHSRLIEGAIRVRN
jgi:hypothetical protein